MASNKRLGKRLVVACDGTWADSDNGFVRDSFLPWKTGGRLAIPTNVTRICRALLPESKDKIPQIAYYQAGLGSEDNAYSFFIGGYLGSGISENIREAYAFICQNYCEGDEIFLLGFSRGAFTARSIGGLIDAIGLLSKKGLADFYPIFRDWENQNNDNYSDRLEGKFFKNRPSFSDPNYVKRLESEGLSRLNIPVKAIGVWDTVGTLGVPDIRGFQSKTRKEYSFINTEVASNVEVALQVLAIDEHRTAFGPTIWEHPQEGKKTMLKELRQCWFPGVHSNVGGSYPDTGVADLTLAWMVSHLSHLLDFDPDYLLEQQRLNIAWYKDQIKPDPSDITKSNKKQEENVRAWGFGKIYNSDSWIDRYLTGIIVRTPGEYCRVDAQTNNKVRLENTKEYIHPSVRVRAELHGRGTNDSNDYTPGALVGWTLYKPDEDYKKGTNPWLPKDDSSYKWVIERDGKVMCITEEVLTDAEFQMLDRSPKSDGRGQVVDMKREVLNDL